MNCDEAIKFLHAYLDKELDAANTMDVEQHIKNCVPCGSAYQELAGLSDSVKNELPYFSAPERLKDKILSNLADAPVEEKPEAPQAKYSIKNIGLAFAASLLIGFALVFNFIHFDSDDQLIEEILAGHINAITANRFADIKTSQVEAVIPWFASKLNYSPKVFNFSAEGFELAGGRLDSLQNQNIAAITYQVDHSIINVYTWPSPDVDDAVQEIHNKNGYHILYWCKNNMNYWIVSDGEIKHVNKLAKLLHRNLKGEASPAP